MENISADKNATVTEKIVEVPVEAGKVIVQATETLGHDVKKGVVEGVTVVAGATETTAREIGAAGQHLGKDLRTAVTPDTKSDVAVAAPPA
jgi:hypothetical protein